jgi:hypothetical protein
MGWKLVCRTGNLNDKTNRKSRPHENEPEADHASRALHHDDAEFRADNEDAGSHQKGSDKRDPRQGEYESSRPLDLIGAIAWY